MNLQNEIKIKNNNFIYIILGVILSVRVTFIGQLYLLEVISVIYFLINHNNLYYK